MIERKIRRVKYECVIFIFKRHTSWLVGWVELEMQPPPHGELWVILKFQSGKELYVLHLLYNYYCTVDKKKLQVSDKKITKIQFLLIAYLVLRLHDRQMMSDSKHEFGS